MCHRSSDIHINSDAKENKSDGRVKISLKLNEAAYSGIKVK